MLCSWLTIFQSQQGIGFHDCQVTASPWLCVMRTLSQSVGSILTVQFVELASCMPWQTQDSRVGLFSHVRTTRAIGFLRICINEHVRYKCGVLIDYAIQLLLG